MKLLYFLVALIFTQGVVSNLVERWQCSGTQQWCDNQCRDVQKDNNYCGNCKTKCANGYECDDGHCSPKCKAPTIQCNDNDKCINPQNDVNNCGKCGNKCKAGEECDDGQCKPKPQCKNPQKCPAQGKSKLRRWDNHCGEGECFCHPDEHGVGWCHPKVKCAGLKKCDISGGKSKKRNPVQCGPGEVCVENCCGKVCRKILKECETPQRRFAKMMARDDGGWTD